MVEDSSLGVSTSLTQRCQILLLVLELLPHSNYIVTWVILLSQLKKLCPQFSSLSLLNCESCQYSKLHCVHLSPKVDKRASTLFELVHSDVRVLVQFCLPLGLSISLLLLTISLMSLSFI